MISFTVIACFAIVGLTIAAVNISVCVSDVQRKKVEVGLETAKLALTREAKKVDVYGIQVDDYIRIPKKISKENEDAYRLGYLNGFESAKQQVIKQLRL